MLKEFTIASVKPTLIGGVGQGGDTGKFVEMFGTAWKKTPKKGVWFIGTSGIQFTMMEIGGGYGMDFAFYDYATVEEFKKDFDDGEHGNNAIYFQLKNTEVDYKYPAIRIIKFLRDQGLWS